MKCSVHQKESESQYRGFNKFHGAVVNACTEIVVGKQCGLPISAGISKFGMNRKARKGLYARVVSGEANEWEVNSFKELGKEAYSWMEFREAINEMKRKVLHKKS